MSHHRLFAQLAFERALGMAALNTLAQAVAESDQFRAEGRDRDPLHFWVLAGELEEVVQDRIRDVLDGPVSASSSAASCFISRVSSSW